MITRIQAQPAQNTFGTGIHQSLAGMLNDTSKNLAKIDGNDNRILSYECHPDYDNFKMLAMTVKGKGKAFFGMFCSPKNIKNNLNECIARFPKYLDTLEKNAFFFPEK